MNKVDEVAFEEFICRWLVEQGGYDEVKLAQAPPDFDVIAGLDRGELFTFIGLTQVPPWRRRSGAHGRHARDETTA